LTNTPDHAEALIYLADVDLKLYHMAAAQPLLERAIRIDPQIELAHLDLGIIYASQGRSTVALREMKIAEQQKPNDQNVHWRLARFYKSIGETEEAKLEFDKTRSVQKAADESIFNKLHKAEDRDKSLSPDIDIITP
jgi:Tfp pilus assembly protein PilF